MGFRRRRMEFESPKCPIFCTDFELISAYFSTPSLEGTLDPGSTKNPRNFPIWYSFVIVNKYAAEIIGILFAIAPTHPLKFFAAKPPQKNRIFPVTSRDRPKLAPYPRLKNSKRTSKFQSILFYSTKNFFEKSLTTPKKN